MTRSASGFWPGAALVCAACSVVGVKGPPARLEPGETPECTSSMTLPLLDFASAIIAGSGAVLLHGQASSERDQPDGGSSKEFRTAAWTATGLALAFIASGAYGSRQVRRCRGLEVSAGVAPVEGPNANWQEESKPGPGQLGSECKRDTDCGEDLVCDEPMRTCVKPPTPPEQPPPPTTAPSSDAGPSEAP